MTDETDAGVGEEAVVVAAEVTSSEVTSSEATPSEATPSEATSSAPRSDERQRIVVFVLLPAIAILLGAGAGFLRWQWASREEAQSAAAASVSAASETATAILSYQADSVEDDLNAARGRLTGSFLDAYTKLVNDVVIPGSKEKKISAVAQVAAAAPVSATFDHAVALVFVNQATTVGNDAPTNTTSSVRVTLDKVGGRWLVSGFEPV